MSLWERKTGTAGLNDDESFTTGDRDWDYHNWDFHYDDNGDDRDTSLSGLHFQIVKEEMMNDGGLGPQKVQYWRRKDKVEMTIEMENTEVRLKERDNDTLKGVDVFLRALKMALNRMILDREEFI